MATTPDVAKPGTGGAFPGANVVRATAWAGFVLIVVGGALSYGFAELQPWGIQSWATGGFLCVLAFVLQILHFDTKDSGGPGGAT